MNVNNMWKILLLVTFLSCKGSANDCVQRNFGILGTNYIVCVCNSTYCDTTPDPNPKIPKNGTFYWYVSTKDGLRLNFSEGQFGSCSNSFLPAVLKINTTKKYQTILGFGGAFTDATGINIKKLTPATQELLMKTYFDKEGSKYSLGRIPIGGSDFNTRPYTYDDFADDVSLKYFSLAPEDYAYKLPFLKQASKLNPEIKYVSAAWTAPGWMKTNNQISGPFGFLKKEYYQVYAEYLLKFLEEYKKNGIDIWAISTGNEPLDSLIPFVPVYTLAWLPKDMGEWVANNLGPTLEKSDYNATKILALDGQRLQLTWYVPSLFKNEKAKNYISGIAVHYYTDFFVSSSVLDKTHNDFPDKFILMSEASIGSTSLPFLKIILGDWNRGQKYFLSIIEYLNNWSVGWIDWNLVLDRSGGPTYIKNNLDAAIIVNPETDEFFKEPMYYAIKHFSRFIDRGSVKVSITDDNLFVKATAVVTPSNEVVVALYNKSPFSKNVILQDVNKEESICLKLEPSSMNTVIYAL